MVNLSTIYGVTIVLGSLAAMGSAYVGTKVYPIQTGGDPLAGPATLAAAVTGAFAAAEKALTPSPEPLSTETVKEQPPAPIVEETPPTPAVEETPPVVEETPPTPAVEETPPVVEETPPTPAVEETPPVVEPDQSVSEESKEKVGGRKLPPWFKHR